MFLIAGPCAIENRDLVLLTAEKLKRICEDEHIALIFKSSFDKANRTSNSPRGVGMDEGMRILQEVKEQFDLPILTDVHESYQCEPAAQVSDVLQIPAFLSRQTDLLQAAARTGRIVNIKKGQFMAPWDLRGAIDKVLSASPLTSYTLPNSNATTTRPLPYDSIRGFLKGDAAPKIWLTERGTTFGYGRLVVDMTSLVEMRQFGYPVIFDATHSVQQPSTPVGITGGNRAMVPHLMRAALAVGVDGIFLEVHPDPDNAISDAANQLKLSDLQLIIKEAKQYDLFAKS